MGLLKEYSRGRYPGECAVHVEFYGLLVWVVFLFLSVIAKLAPPHAAFPILVARNYGIDLFTTPTWTYVLLFYTHLVGGYWRRSRPVLWSGWPMWAMPAFALVVGYLSEASQFAERPSHGDWRDDVMYTVGFIITIIPLVWANRRDRQRRSFHPVQS